MDGIDFDLADWAHLPPLDDAELPTEPPPERDYVGGITIGSALVAVAFGSDIGTDLGHAVCQGLASVHPGLAELAMLGSTDLDDLDAVQRIDAVIAIDRQGSWLAARKQELLALISTRDHTEQHWCIEEIGAALRLTGGATRTVLADAEQLVDRLPETLAALADGRLNPAQATAVTRGSYQLPDGVLPTYEARVLGRVDGQSITGLKRSITRAVLALDPATAEQKHQHALADRHVRIAPAEHGMTWLLALLPAEDAHAIYARLTDTAKANRVHATARTIQGTDHDRHPQEDDRNLDQLRADTLINGVLHGVQGRLPAAHGRQPAVSVVVSASTLLGQDDEPGWLDNYGPITAGHARQLAHDPTGTWRRLVTDPVSGQLLDYGTTRYRPPRHLADQVVARDSECTFPYCSHAARHADLDHLRPYPHGPTSAANLQPLHRRHHNAKTHAGWRPIRNATTGRTNWTSPQGRTYPSQPPERWTAPEPPPF